MKEEEEGEVEVGGERGSGRRRVGIRGEGRKERGTRMKKGTGREEGREDGGFVQIRQLKEGTRHLGGHVPWLDSHSIPQLRVDNLTQLLHLQCAYMYSVYIHIHV